MFLLVAVPFRAAGRCALPNCGRCVWWWNWWCWLWWLSLCGRALDTRSTATAEANKQTHSYRCTFTGNRYSQLNTNTCVHTTAQQTIGALCDGGVSDTYASSNSVRYLLVCSVHKTGGGAKWRNVSNVTRTIDVQSSLANTKSNALDRCVMIIWQADAL